jgi:molecular chaperone DnaK (HSP70)
VGGSCSLPKLATLLRSSFPSPTTVLPTPYNPSELISRGAAIQASLISSFDAQTIAEAIHPIVTLVGHLARPIGVLSAPDRLDVILEGDTAVPCRGKTGYKSAEGGDVLFEVWEGRRETEVVPAMPTAPGEDEEDEPEEEQEVRRRIVVPETKLATVKVPGVLKNGEVEVLIQVESTGTTIIVGREIGRKHGKVTKVVLES